MSRPEPPQPREGKPGDPQLAALHQCLADRGELSADDAIVDIGSGAGILATAMEAVWKTGSMPLYVAVDLQQQLDQLSLPVSVHNNSQKVEFDVFLQTKIETLKKRIKLVVLRNIFHELDIFETARVLARLNSTLLPGTEIYVQDMERLPRPERGNAGWDHELFERMLQHLPMAKTNVVSLYSYGRTKWFSVIAQVAGTYTTEVAAAAACAEARREQKARMAAELREKNQKYDEESLHDVTVLPLEIAYIETQLQNYELTVSSRPAAEPQVTIGASVISLRRGSEGHAYLASTDAMRMADQTGLVAMLRNKDDVDMPRLLRSSKKIIWFAGYSDKLTFIREANVQALVDDLGRKVSVKVLVADPNSDITRLRSMEPVYANEDKLIENINNTIGVANIFYRQYPKRGRRYNAGKFDVRRSKCIPACSDFFIDELCVCSLYSSLLSGGKRRAWCFARRSQAGPGIMRV